MKANRIVHAASDVTKAALETEVAGPDNLDDLADELYVLVPDY